MNSIYDLLTRLSGMFRWLVIIAPWEQCVRVRLGKHVQLLTAGVHLRIPLCDVVYRQSVRHRRSVIRPQTLTTLDNQTITLSGVLGYEIADFRKLIDSLEHPEDTIEAEVCSAIANYVARHEFEQCLPDKIEEYVQGKIDLARYGLRGQEFRLANFAVVRTLRIITGDIPAWANSAKLCTLSPDSQPRL